MFLGVPSIGREFPKKQKIKPKDGQTWFLVASKYKIYQCINGMCEIQSFLCLICAW